MKKLFLLAATLLSMSVFAQEQGDDNGFGLKLHAGFCGEKYGSVKTDVDLGSDLTQIQKQKSTRIVRTLHCLE